MTGTKAFVDTNVFLYANSDGNPVKQARSVELIHRLNLEGRLLLSTQVVQEFYAAGSRKLKLARPLLLEAVADLLGYPMVVIRAEEIRAALEKEERHQISFWDGLIVAAAESGGADVVYSEDLNDGQRYGEVVVKNPFGG